MGSCSCRSPRCKYRLLINMSTTKQRRIIPFTSRIFHYESVRIWNCGVYLSIWCGVLVLQNIGIETSTEKLFEFSAGLKYSLLQVDVTKAQVVIDGSIANSGPSVRPSVTHVIHAWMIQDIETCFAPHNRTIFLVSWGQISWSWV